MLLKLYIKRTTSHELILDLTNCNINKPVLIYGSNLYRNDIYKYINFIQDICIKNKHGEKIDKKYPAWDGNISYIEVHYLSADLKIKSVCINESNFKQLWRTYIDFVNYCLTVRIIESDTSFTNQKHKGYERLYNISINYQTLDTFEIYKKGCFIWPNFGEGINYKNNIIRLQNDPIFDLDFNIIFTNDVTLINQDLVPKENFYNSNNFECKQFISLTDKEIRKSHNLEKMYRAGAFDV